MSDHRADVTHSNFLSTFTLLRRFLDLQTSLLFQSSKAILIAAFTTPNPHDNLDQPTSDKICLHMHAFGHALCLAAA